jgi:hypothetical protein
LATVPELLPLLTGADAAVVVETLTVEDVVPALVVVGWVVLLVVVGAAPPEEELSLLLMKVRAAEPYSAP